MTHDTDALKTLLAGAIVQYGCGRNHVHIGDLPEIEVAESGLWAIRFELVTCPDCEADRTGWIPPSRIQAIWGQTGEDSKRARLGEIILERLP